MVLRGQISGWETGQELLLSARKAAIAIATSLSKLWICGVYALDAEDSTGLDEQIARKFLLAGEYDLVVNILDAANLERNFYLTSQLLDLGVPLILVLNMMDVARAAKIKMDIPALSQRLGLPVLPFVPNNNSILLNCGKLFAPPWQHHLFPALVCPNPL